MGSLSVGLGSKTGSFQCCTETGSGLLMVGTATGPALKSFDKPAGAAAKMSDFSLSSALASPEEFNPCAAARFPNMPRTSGSANDRSFIAEDLLTPPALATIPPTD